MGFQIAKTSVLAQGGGEDRLERTPIGHMYVDYNDQNMRRDYDAPLYLSGTADGIITAEAAFPWGQTDEQGPELYPLCNEVFPADVILELNTGEDGDDPVVVEGTLDRAGLHLGDEVDAMLPCTYTYEGGEVPEPLAQQQLEETFPINPTNSQVEADVEREAGSSEAQEDQGCEGGFDFGDAIVEILTGENGDQDDKLKCDLGIE